MAAVIEPDRSEVIELTSEDVEAAVRNALADAGCSFDELAGQARSGRFMLLRARLAWIAVGGFYEGPGCRPHLTCSGVPGVCRSTQ